MCYEILADEALRNPPIPLNVSEAEAEEYRLQFEELGYKLQDEAYGIYRDVYDKGGQGVTSGEFLDMSYSRLFSRYPNEVGVKVEKDTLLSFRSDKEWLFSSMQPTQNWRETGFVDTAWAGVKKGQKPDSVSLLGFSELPTPIWGGELKDGKFLLANELWLRKNVQALQKPHKLSVECAGTGPFEIFVNGVLVLSDSMSAGQPWFKARKKEGVENLMKNGRNTIAVHIRNSIPVANAFYLNASFEDRMSEVRPKIPSLDKTMTRDEMKKLKFSFALIHNFEYKSDLFMRSGL